VPEQAHRKLTTHQKAVLIQVLLSFPGERVKIVYSATAADGLAYGTDFMAIFKAIGWDVTGPTSEDNLADDSPGLALLTSENTALPACALALQDALRIYQIEVESRVEKSRGVATGGFLLWVGPQGQQF
jgi:hypothetical protein